PRSVGDDDPDPCVVAGEGRTTLGAVAMSADPEAGEVDAGSVVGVGGLEGDLGGVAGDLLAHEGALAGDVPLGGDDGTRSRRLGGAADEVDDLRNLRHGPHAAIDREAGGRLHA